MEIEVAERKVQLLQAAISVEEAVNRAEGAKGSAFGTMNRLMSRAKGEDVAVRSMERRVDPLWEVRAHRRVVFDRRRAYEVPVVDGTVKSVTYEGVDHPVDNGHYRLTAVDNCVSDTTIERVIDAVSETEIPAASLARAHRSDLPDADSFPADTVVIPPEVRMSKVVQSVLQVLLAPYDADQVFEEVVAIPEVNLLYRPVFAFECVWEARGKTAIVEVDGVTGEARAGSSRAFGAKRTFDRDMLFDVGAETINLVVPGGAIAVKVGKALLDRRAKGS